MMIGSQLAAEKAPRQPACSACRYHATLRELHATRLHALRSVYTLHAASGLRSFMTTSDQLRADSECLCKPANHST